MRSSPSTSPWGHTKKSHPSTSRAKTEAGQRSERIFTGLIRAVGAVTATQSRDGGLRLSIAADALEGARSPGDSIAVNGVCLTVASRNGAALEFDVIPETLARSNLGELSAGSEVNLEPSLKVGETLDGHLVYGHVDATTVILRVEPEGQGLRVWLATPPLLAPLVCRKGYVALDGISLTVADADDGRFAVALIPETLKRTTLGRKRPGDVLNIEADPVARYVAAVLGNHN
ncbi:MAG TPA: riboflavin synthase [Candidatus Eremiobacteraceae bacterium]|nr:riboflavin synthase [Candidatus Eremiobacteraceae bacterium]